MASLKVMRENNYKEADENEKCAEGFSMNGMWCITAYQWCEPIEKIIKIDIFKQIELHLKDSKQIIAVKNIPNFNLPKGIDEIQIKKYFQIGDIYFAFVYRSNMNFSISSDSKFSGVLIANSGDTEWQKFFEIKNLDRAKNNPIFFGNEKEKFSSY